MIKIFKNDSCISTELEDNLIILNTDSGIYFELNFSGAFIWKLLDDENDLNSIKSLIVNKFNLTEPEAEEDLKSFIDYCSKKELILVCE